MISSITSSLGWHEFEHDQEAQRDLLALLPPIMQQARWFGGKAYKIKSLSTDHCLPYDFDGARYYFFIVETVYDDHPTEYYLIPLAFDAERKSNMLCSFKSKNESGFLHDACFNEHFQKALFENIKSNTPITTSLGALQFEKGKLLEEKEPYTSSRNPNVDQSNSSIFFNEKYFMKIYRKLFLDTNPEVDMLRFLTETGEFKNIPSYTGSLVWTRKKTAPVTFALMMSKVDAQKDNWVSTGDELNDFLKSFIHGDFSIHEFVFENVELLAQRTAEMHLALFSPTKDKAFKSEKFTPEYREWLFQHLKDLLDGRLKMIEQHRDQLDEEALRMADKLKRKQKLVLQFFEQIKTKPLKSLRTRIHGDYHLGQILYHQKDYIVIDFEGEPESSISDRKIKHSPMKDVAGIVRSFHYAVSAKLFFSNETKNSDAIRLQKATDRWYNLISNTFWETYYQKIGKDNKLYASKAEINFLFLLHLLEKAIYEIGYELNGRPDWLKIPLKGIEQVINELEKYEG